MSFAGFRFRCDESTADSGHWCATGRLNQQKSAIPAPGEIPKPIVRTTAELQPFSSFHPPVCVREPLPCLIFSLPSGVPEVHKNHSKKIGSRPMSSGLLAQYPGCHAAMVLNDRGLQRIDKNGFHLPAEFQKHLLIHQKPFLTIPYDVFVALYLLEVHSDPRAQ